MKNASFYIPTPAKGHEGDGRMVVIGPEGDGDDSVAYLLQAYRRYDSARRARRGEGATGPNPDVDGTLMEIISVECYSANLACFCIPQTEPGRIVPRQQPTHDCAGVDWDIRIVSQRECQNVEVRCAALARREVARLTFSRGALSLDHF